MADAFPARVSKHAQAIALVPMGDAKTWFFPALEPVLRSTFGRKVLTGSRMPLPPGAWRADRRQYRSARRTVIVESRCSPPGDSGHEEQDDFSSLVATEAVHELGHTYGLDHGPDRRCVMWFSNTVEESRRKGFRLCPRHAAELHAAASAREA